MTVLFVPKVGYRETVDGVGEVAQPQLAVLVVPCFKVQGSGFRVKASGCRVQGAGFRVQGTGFRVQGSGFRVQGPGSRVQGSGFRVQGSGSRVQGSGSAQPQLAVLVVPCLRDGCSGIRFLGSLDSGFDLIIKP